LNNEPIWRLVQDCAKELTRAGKVPFTRGDIVACVQKRRAHCDENSINPIIQGLTDNLKGGAPGADGKKILHSVGRGQFVLHSKKDSAIATSVTTPSVSAHRAVRHESAKDFPDTEGGLRDNILNLLRQRLQEISELEIRAEGTLLYTLPDGKQLRHASDILITHGPSGKHLSIELKYRSAVTDQFKCRAYDAWHMKKEHGDDVRTIMLYAKSTTGLSIAQAERICYPFDLFIGLPAVEIGPALIERLEREARTFLTG
jgi:hypothetical protein